MLIEALLLNGLLGNNVAGREENLFTIHQYCSTTSYVMFCFEPMWWKVGAGLEGASRSIEGRRRSSYRRSDALREQRRALQLCLVPAVPTISILFHVRSRSP